MAEQDFRVGQRIQIRKAIIRPRKVSVPPGEYVITKIGRGFLWMSRRYRIKSIPDEDIDVTLKEKQLAEAVGQR